MFIRVKIDNLKEFSKFRPLILNKDNNKKRDNIKIIIVKKYLFISLVSNLIFEKRSLFIKIFFGLLNERIWFNEYFVNEYNFKNLKPELVEKKEPPTITNNKKIKFKLFFFISSEKPIFEILLTKDKKFLLKLLSKLKKIKKIVTKKIRYKNRWISS